jgi:iron complex transport system ATP-binding protein
VRVVAGDRALEAVDVAVRYDAGARDALRGVDLAVSRGETLVVVGPNGAGKSTLLGVMAGALEATAGNVRLFGEPALAQDRRDIAQRVAFVTQSAEVAFGFTVREVVMMGRAPHQAGWMTSSAADEQAVDDALGKCELRALEGRRVDALSGGEQKRVAIARAIAQSPKLLLLDEPGAFLDVRHQLALYDLLVDLAKQNLAVVLSMHDINAAAQWASRVALLKSGKLVAIGSVEDVLTYPRLRETFDADLYCGINDVNGTRFFLPMRGSS